MEQNADYKLFTIFPPVSTQQWEEKIKEDLKGADYDKKLIWRTVEGINIKPYYRKENLADIDYLQSDPGTFPFTRSGKLENNDWEIRQDINVNNIAEANRNALNILERGVTSLGLKIDKKIIGSKEKFSVLLKDIYLDCISLNIIAGKDSQIFLDFLIAEIKSRGIDGSRLQGSLDFDPLGYLTLKGNYFTDKKSDFSELKELIRKTAIQLPDFKIISINGLNYSNTGASVTQELAFSLSIGCEYLTTLTELGLKPEEIAPRIQFVFGAGSNYFMEIAKLRAARTLWSKIVESYGIDTEHASPMFIHSVVTEWNKTIFDPHVNILRATTEAMSAVLGGTNSLLVTPFNSLYSEESDLSSRIARNIQIILKEEAYFGKVVDPSAGSYCIENLTDNIIEHAWKLFLEIEEKGGYSEAFKDGFIQEMLNQTVKKRLNLVATRKEVLLGTNQFPNSKEGIKNDFNVKQSEEKNLNSTIAEPIKTLRGAAEIEEIRIKIGMKKPVVFLLPIGNHTMRKARTGFSTNFFACGGFEVIDNIGFATVEEGIKEARKANANIVVLCSSDDEYSTFAPQACELLKDKTVLVIAGEPACKPDLETRGIKNFISIRSDLVESLKYYSGLLEI